MKRHDLEDMDEKDHKEELGDFISEQTFTKAQTSAQNAEGARLRDVDAIEDIELENRVPLRGPPDIDELNAAYSPQADSAGDSAEYIKEEVLLGLGFRPEGEDPFEDDDDDEDIENFDKEDPIHYAEENSKSASEHPGLDRT